MTALNNSCTPVPNRPESSDSAPPARMLQELFRSAWRAVVRVAGGIRWYTTNLMGDSAYETYVAHHRRHHPDEEPPTERQFWRQRMDDQDRNPGARCC